MSCRKRVLVLPISAAIILALMAYKYSRTYSDRTTAFTPGLKMLPEPLSEFALYDSNNRLVRFQRYVGRHRIVVVFFDGQAGADKDETLLKLGRDYDRIHATGTIVVAVSAAIPQQNRKARQRQYEKVEEQYQPFPFPLLSDIPRDPQTPPFAVHKLWGRFDETTGKPLPGVFLVDRAGRVAWSGTAPRPLKDPAAIFGMITER